MKIFCLCLFFFLLTQFSGCSLPGRRGGAEPAAEPPAEQPAQKTSKVLESGAVIHQHSLESRLHLAKPPAGFAWHLFKNSLFLAPKEWRTHSLEGELGGLPFSTWAASPQRFSEKEPFTIGLTVQVLSGGLEQRQVEPRIMAQLYLEPFLRRIEDPKKDLLQMEEQEEEGESRIMLRYRQKAGNENRMVQKFTITSAAADTVNVFTFEAPEKRWDELWAKYGQRFLSGVAVLKPRPEDEEEYELRTE